MIDSGILDFYLAVIMVSVGLFILSIIRIFLVWRSMTPEERDDVVTAGLLKRAGKILKQNNIPPATCEECGGKFYIYGFGKGISMLGWIDIEKLNSPRITCDLHKLRQI